MRCCLHRDGCRKTVHMNGMESDKGDWSGGGIGRSPQEGMSTTSGIHSTCTPNGNLLCDASIREWNRPT